MAICTNYITLWYFVHYSIKTQNSNLFRDLKVFVVFVIKMKCHKIGVSTIHTSILRKPCVEFDFFIFPPLGSLVNIFLLIFVVVILTILFLTFPTLTIQSVSPWYILGEMTCWLFLLALKACFHKVIIPDFQTKTGLEGRHIAINAYTPRTIVYRSNEKNARSLRNFSLVKISHQ